MNINIDYGNFVYENEMDWLFPFFVIQELAFCNLIFIPIKAVNWIKETIGRQVKYLGMDEETLNYCEETPS
jgi:hypothetical protein